MRGWVFVLLSACGRVGFDPLTAAVPDATADAPQIVAPGTSTQLSVGKQHVCIVNAAHQLWCWGLNSTGQLGLGAASYPTDQPTPQRVAPTTTWAEVASGWRHTCALDSTGAAWCWGSNSNGQLGLASPVCGNGVVDAGEQCDDGGQANGDTCTNMCQLGATSPDVVDPTLVNSLVTFQHIYAGAYHTCGIATTGELYCWGRNGAGELGIGGTLDRSHMQRVGTATSWMTVGLGDDHSCALQNDLSMWCWGNNADGELGEGAGTIDALHPGEAQPGSTWRLVAGGFDFSCSLGDDTRTYCFGRDDQAQLGIGTLSAANTPTEVNNAAPTDRMAVGDGHACARYQDGTLMCWGTNDQGQLGRGYVGSPDQPAPIAGTWLDVGAGVSYTCAFDLQSVLWCWGAGDNGRLGDGNTNDSATPVMPLLP